MAVDRIGFFGLGFAEIDLGVGGAIEHQRRAASKRLAISASVAMSQSARVSTAGSIFAHGAHPPALGQHSPAAGDHHRLIDILRQCHSSPSAARLSVALRPPGRSANPPGWSHRVCDKLDRRLVPIQHRPLQSAAAALQCDLCHRLQQLSTNPRRRCAGRTKDLPAKCRACRRKVEKVGKNSAYPAGC